MLGGQVAVFVSCSEKFKEKVAWPVRDALAEHGLRGIIVTDEPLLPGTGEGTSGEGGSGEGGSGGARRRDAKVESYLNASSAFVALCTADYALSDGTTYPRANIIDEIQLASMRPRLRDRSQILKPPEVLLPSSITPTYDRLDIASPAAAAAVILKQLKVWGVMSPASPPRVAGSAADADADTDTAGDLRALCEGLRPDDPGEATRRVYRLLAGGNECDGRRTARALHREVLEGPGRAGQLVGAALLEAMARLHASLISVEMIETLTAGADYPARSCAANLLRDRAAVAPLGVPLPILGRLAVPSAEDWYVWAPAMAAVKELVLRRRDAYAILESLCASAEPQDRYAVAQVLLDVAAVRPAAVARNLAERLLEDPDPLVAHKAQDVLTAVEHVSDADRAACYARFTL
jgi:hypothetical protein